MKAEYTYIFIKFDLFNSLNSPCSCYLCNMDQSTIQPTPAMLALQSFDHVTCIPYQYNVFRYMFIISTIGNKDYIS